MADNWYTVLELEFDPPVEDEGKISARIEEKAKFWSTHFNDFKMGAQYRAWHQNISQIKKDMIGGANIRKKLAQDACTQLYSRVDKLLKTIGRKGHITTDEAEKLSKKEKVSLDIVRRRATALGIPEKQAQVNYQSVYDKYYKSKPQNAPVFDGMRQMLASFHVENLYEFLYAGTKVKDAGALPCSTLRQRADEKKKIEFYKTDNISGTGAKLCGQCQLAFKDDQSKAIYDNYLEYIKRKSVLDDAKNIAEISGELAQEEFESFVGQLTQIFRDRKLAVDVLTAFCKVEKLAYKSGAAEEGRAKIKVCRCGCMNDVSDGRTVCSRCGLELTIRCPQCGTENDANIKVCKCGFRFENLDRAMALCEQAELAIDELELKAAAVHLSDAEHYWPGSRKLQELRTRLADVEKRVGSEVAKMRAAIGGKRYMEAQKQYTAIRKLFPNYADQDVEQEINTALSSAQSLFQQAQRAKAEKDVLELCGRAYDVCGDLPGVKELLAQYPPAPAAGFSVSADSGTRGNIITWIGDSSDKSIRYVVVRSSASWVQHAAGGEEIFRGSACSYCDRDIEPGVPYYYNVFAERAGVYSKGAEGDFKETINLFEIAGVSVAAGDGSLNLMWQALPKNAAAEIYQLTDGGEKHIASSLSDSFLISNLANNTPCRFRVALSYLVGGKRQETRGLTVSGVPVCPPAPVDTLRVKPGEDGLVEAVWQTPRQGEVRLFTSVRRPSHKAGDLVALAALEREMRPVQQRPLPPAAARELKPDESGAVFSYTGSELLYVTAVVVKSGTAVFGAVARVSMGERVTIKGAGPVNGKIHIRIDPPKDATGFVVLCRFDQYPEDISDVNTIRKYIPLKQYQLTGALVLDMLEDKKYYFSVYAEFQRDGEKDYSAGTDCLFDNSAKVNITYSVSVSKKPAFLGGSSVTLIFEADAGRFTLPDIEIMSAVGNVPMFKEAAERFYSVPSQQVNGTLSVKIPIPERTPKGTHIKAFFKDEAAQAGNQLRLKQKSSYKIN